MTPFSLLGIDHVVLRIADPDGNKVELKGPPERS